VNSYKGLFSEILTIRPWEMRLLTADEFDGLRRYVDAKNKGD
jgi:hypothetical protein